MDLLARGILRTRSMRGMSRMTAQTTTIRGAPFTGYQRLLYTDREHSQLVVPHLKAPHISCSQDADHVRQVAQRLQQDGILKVTLEFADDESRYLEALIRSLHARHGHHLPLAHSATRGWFWEVRPSSASFQTANHQARSETMRDFPWHTDCSYEYPPPRFFALQVLQPDRFGGGTLSVMSVERLVEEHLGGSRCGATLATLMKPDAYRITIPTEFVKGQQRGSGGETRQWIRGGLIMADNRGRPTLIRFREDIITPLSDEAAAALQDLKAALQSLAAQGGSTIHLSATDLPARSIILIDNMRWLHARNHVLDPKRHLRRVRWDAAPFPGASD